MKLVVLNGSPRRTGSNTKLLMDVFLEGFNAEDGQEAEHIGSVTKGGVEGIQIQPEKWKARLKDHFRRLGEGVSRSGTFDPTILTSLRKPWVLSPVRRWVYNVMSRIGLADFYWDYNLKKNGAFQERFARPYE